MVLSEVRWTGHGISELDGRTVFHSGLAEGLLQSRQSGVAVIMSERAVAARKQAGSVFSPVPDRLLRVHLRSHTGFVTIIAVYAPTNEPGNAEEADKFYQALQECVNTVPKRDMLHIMGDFNARVGNDARSWQGLLGRFGSEEQNPNGDRLLDFCSFNGMVGTNTVFQHRPRH